MPDIRKHERVPLLRHLSREGLLQNALALWAVQALRKTLPFVILPFLARTLGPHGWGLVATFQGFAAALILIIEFGFGLSATRQVARSRVSKDKLASIFSGVLGAQLFVIASTSLVLLTLASWVPVLRENPALLAIAVCWGFAEGCVPNWYFVGIERMRVVATLEIASKTIAAILIFSIVHSAADVWIVLLLQALAPVLSLTAGMSIVYRQIPFRLPTAYAVREALAAAWPMFLIRSAESLYTISNAFLLSLFAGPTVVAYFAGPEKISRAVSGLFNPVRETLYPRLSKLIHAEPGEAARLARLGMLVTGLGGLVMSAAMFISAPLAVRILLGPQFTPAVAVLRVLAILPLLITISQCFGMQWLLPLGRERFVSRLMLLAGVLNLLLAFLFVPKFAHQGMAWAVVCAEAFVCVGLAARAAFDQTHRFPFWPARDAIPSIPDPAYEAVEPDTVVL